MLISTFFLENEEEEEEVEEESESGEVEEEEEEDEVEGEEQEALSTTLTKPDSTQKRQKEPTWVGLPLKTKGNGDIYYGAVIVEGHKFRIGDSCFFTPNSGRLIVCNLKNSSFICFFRRPTSICRSNY